jgi:Domain of unknown function (DUF2760)
VNADVSPLPFPARLWLAWVYFFRVLFDGAFAGRVRALDTDAASRAGAPAKHDAMDGDAPTRRSPSVAPPSSDAALQLLALLQREGRLIDFLQQDVTAFADADIGAAARVVHDGCRKALAAHLEIKPVRDEREGGPVTLEVVEPNAVKLVGNVSGTAPFRGTLRHRGWRVESLRLPELVAGYDPRVLAPAEVEL